MTMRLILASASLRRRDLLNQIGYTPDVVVPAEVDEDPLPRERPRDLAERLSRLKAGAIAEAYPDDVVLAADTVVALGHRCLGKPADATEARTFLTKLSGRRHRVYGGVCIITPDGRVLSKVVMTQVRFKRLSERDVTDYLADGEWKGKAGGYAIQGRAAAFIPWINGSYTNVVGLPLMETASLLQSAGISPRAE